MLVSSRTPECRGRGIEISLPRRGRGGEAEERVVVAIAQAVAGRRLFVADTAGKLRRARDRLVRDRAIAHRWCDDRVAQLADGGDHGRQTVAVECEGYARRPSHSPYLDRSLPPGERAGSHVSSGTLCPRSAMPDQDA